MPPDRPIYFSVDFDVTSTQWPDVRDALRGAGAAIGAARVGVYGGRHAIEWARRDGVAAWYWQTYAWSGGFWVVGNHIEQYRNGVILAGAALDLDRAMVSDFGQWPMGRGDMLNQAQDDALSIAWEHAEAFTQGLADTPARKRPHWGVTTIAQIATDVAEIKRRGGANVDVAALVVALRPEIEAAVRSVLGSLDNPATP
jgi:hypothetical protein